MKIKIVPSKELSSQSLRAEDYVKPLTEYRVVCDEHGPQCISQADYFFQLRMEDALWKCPICAQDADWDDAWNERITGLCDVEVEHEGKTYVGIVEALEGIDAVVYVYDLGHEIKVPAGSLRDAIYVSGGQR